ncbi:UvrD-helicase domain-containing protein [Granulosicoccus antarcticus]|uniref:DNA 3'-5' helicase n=1 Tax=Granulosicoccus antarcticus IMCC3135 TaxID=1192854 RepID=A0A2Z2NY84_9GAMM|nr:UvrD-helicase domain-containing protein [Granulosicoccus antarcticus]ASJ76412.1 ATP-dependent helicase/nuclease subunit A [Granulosicoccus antarcticus IMCC3135]
MSAPLDAAVRARALDPQTSFIVQAPAGSGKTELLTRRILTLLQSVEEPEEILAITFTRKAASEMRQRVVETLERANSGEPASNVYEEEGLALARDVLKRDAERQWQLIRNPQRLNLRTIDALATQLAHRLPVTSALGAPTGIVEDASALYRDVASRFIESNIDSMGLVLLQVGNRLEQARQLLANLLASRDQWKRHVYGFGDNHDELRAILESMLGELVESRLDNLYALVPDVLIEGLPERLHMACGFLLEDAEGDLSELPEEMQGWLDLEELPGTSLEDLSGWDGIGAALLTKSGGLRKRLTKAEGFPAKGDAKKRGVEPALLVSHKEHMLELLERVAESPEFIEALAEVCSLPYPRYRDEQWALLSQLLGVLPKLLLELHMVFAERRVVDFTELAERAQRALGTEQEPTDLALSMDLSLKHILVDEFQDTSQTQFRLFAQLVGGWEPGDGRTFFVVGDPMQSIYRFRDGDVALFAQAGDDGIGPVKLESLTLSVNFRAAPDVIKWVNQIFASIFPKRADADSGAVTYSPSDAHLTTDGGVQVHTLVNKERFDEAELVACLAAEALAIDPQHTVAILVRTRSQAGDIFDALRARSLAYESIDMDQVGERAVVRDLVSLCLALRYPHDRLHWLSLLRAPFVGMTLNDLHALMSESGREATVIELLRDPARLALLSADGQARAARLLPILEPALKRASRGRLLPWVESVWLQLGGPVVCRDAVDRDAAERALARLSSLEADGRLWEKSVLTEVMKSLYAANAEEGECRIQVMTLHKAKGLEFGTVILPALDRQPRGDSTQLLNWFESTLDGRPQLLLAPLEQSGLPPGRRDRINRLVRKARERCDEQEKLRLLYVACTRARHHLHLIGRIRRNTEDQYQTPINSSLLKPLWPLLEPDLPTEDTHKSPEPISPAPEEVSDTHKSLAEISDTHEPPGLPIESDPVSATVSSFERLPVDVEMPSFVSFEWEKVAKKQEVDSESVKFSWAGRTARDIGTVVHQQLQMLAQSADSLANVDFDALGIIAERQLRNMGVQKEMLPQATETVLLAVRSTLADERGRWALSPHAEARSEWALSVVQEAEEGDGDPEKFMGVWNREVRQMVIDRTFVDEQGVRWIVDFKTGDHQGGQVELFLDSEQMRYADQLNRYADIIRRMDEGPVRVGLYFPLLKGWREWEPPNREQGSKH